MQTWKCTLIRGAGFGAGFAVAAAIVFVSVFWWNERPKPWSSKAITSKIGELTMQRRGEELHLDFEYALKNNTRYDYRLPSAPTGNLMRVIKETGSVAKVENVMWPDVMVPAYQTVTVRFDVTYPFSEYNTTAAELDGSSASGEGISKGLTDFAGRRLKSSKDGFVFLDEVNRYRIELPSNWQAAAK